ncbi:MAG: hypothetical protein AAGB06_05050, partial [Verrucomicrobiota bacterium]
SILITWDIKVTVSESNGSISGNLADMSLQLYRGENPLQISDSMVDNVEHIWRDSTAPLSAGEYAFTVTTDTDVTYAIAWRGDLYQGYDLWRSVAFSNSTPSDEQDREDDPDQDGMMNLMEMALLTDPESHQINVTPVQKSFEVDENTYEQIEVAIPTHGNDLTYEAETTTDLTEAWSSESSEISLIEINESSPGVEQHIFRRTNPREADAKAFIRLKVTE